MPYSDPAKRRQVQRNKARRRREAGLCASCNNPRLPDKSRCKSCWESRAQPPSKGNS